MNRLSPINKENGNPKSLEILAGVQKALGIIPNMVAIMAQSPAVVGAYVSFSHSLSQGALPARLREQIALAVAEENACDYCLSAHTFLGEKAGLKQDDVLNARRGTSADPRIAAALVFARKVLETRGQVNDADLTVLREHGYTDGEVAEIIAHVALNIFTNYFNVAAETEIDFPRAPKLTA